MFSFLRWSLGSARTENGYLKSQNNTVGYSVKVISLFSNGVEMHNDKRSQIFISEDIQYHPHILQKETVKKIKPNAQECTCEEVELTSSR